MDPYLFTLVLGFGGLILMALLGMAHGGHQVRTGHSAHAHHGPAPARGGKATPSIAGAGRSHGTRESRATGVLLGLLSPRVLFSLLLGFGAAGTLLQPYIHWPALLAVLSVVAALFFERGLIQPLWSFLLNFASQPARTLDSMLLEEGQAASDFDGSGRGLVMIDLDGQTRQILGTLCRGGAHRRHARPHRGSPFHPRHGWCSATPAPCRAFPAKLVAGRPRAR